MTTTRTTMTLERFLALPERKPALEYERGRVTQKVSPKARHSALQTGMAEMINRQIRPRKLGRAFTELRATYEDLSRVPDIAVYRWDRIPLDEAGELVDDFFHPPDIAIEVASPGQRVSRLMQRCRTFVAAGVKAAVLIRPQDRSVTVVRPDGNEARLVGGDVLDLSDIIPDLHLDITALFDELKN